MKVRPSQAPPAHQPRVVLEGERGGTPSEVECVCRLVLPVSECLQMSVSHSTLNFSATSRSHPLLNPP